MLVNEKEVQKLYPHVFKERIAFFFSGINTGMAGLFLLARFTSPPQLHVHLSILFGMTFCGAVTFWLLSSHHQKKIAEISSQLEQELKKEKGDG